jgi:hypothetical protein
LINVPSEINFNPTLHQPVTRNTFNVATMKGDGAQSSTGAPPMLTNEIVVQSMSSFNSTNFFSKKINQEKLLQKPYYLGGAKYTLRKKMPIYQSDTSMVDGAQE